MVKVLEKANVLLAFVAQSCPVSFSELLCYSGFNKSTLSQILKTMVYLSWLERNNDGMFTIGSGVENFARSMTINHKLREIYCRAAEEFNRGMNELVTVAIFRNSTRQLIAKHEGNHFVKVNESSSSLPASMFSTATGLVLLSGMDESVRKRFVSKNSLHSELKKSIAIIDGIKEKGFAELELGRSDAFAVAVGVCNSYGKMVASIGFSAPCYRFDEKKKQEAIKKLKKCALEIGKSL